VSRQLQREGSDFAIRPPKYGSERVVYLPDELVTILSKHIATVDAKQRRQAGEVFEVLAGHPERLIVNDSRQPAGLPPELARILATVVEVMARGGTVTIGSLPEELTTTVAADQLGISRPTLMKLINEGKLPAHRVGTHRRVKLSDVQAFKRTRLQEQRRAFAELSELSDQLDAI
jgi:excisionase family DNA binding protein